MRRLSRLEAQRLGRLGGKAASAGRVGDREWARRAECQRAARAMHNCYPGLTVKWATNAARERWGRSLLPVPEVPLTGRRLEQREARRLARRRRAYENAICRAKRG